MNKPNKLITCGTTALFAAALGLQAQTSSSTSTTQSTAGSSASSNYGATSGSQSMPSTTTQAGTQYGSTSAGSQYGSQNGTTSAGSQYGSSASTVPSSSSGTAMTPGTTAQSPSASTWSSQSNPGSTSASGSASATGSMSTSSSSFGAPASSSQSTYSSTQPSNSYTQPNTSGSSAAGSYNTQQQYGSQDSFATSAQSETQVTTFVQQMDAQGPAVVQQISTQVGDLACSQDTLQNLVEALHSGKSVTISSDVNGQSKSATFNAPGAHLGYGEAYIALALAAQQLRNAGVTSCATPEQWQAVLLGGPLHTSVSSSSTNSFASAGGSTQLPGIVTLHTQGQGWGQIAQSANLQLGQIISPSSVSANNQATSSSSLSPTGYSSQEMNRGRTGTPDFNTHTDNGKHKGQKKHWWSRNKDADKDDRSTSENNPAPAHADSSASSGASSSSTPTTR